MRNLSIPPNPFIKQPTATPKVPPQLVNVLDATYMNDTIPAVMTPGQKYDVSIVMNNTGGIPWSNAGHIVMAALNDGANDAPLFNNTTFFIEPGVMVYYGNTYAWKFSVTAPQ